MNHGRLPQDLAKQPLLPGLSAEAPQRAPADAETWLTIVRDALSARDPAANQLAEAALRACPGDPDLLLLAALTVLMAEDAARAERLLKRYAKHYVAGKSHALLVAMTAAAQGQVGRAAAILQAERLESVESVAHCFVGSASMLPWLTPRLDAIKRAARAAPRRNPAPRPAVRRTPLTSRAPARPAPAAPSSLPDLPRLTVPLTITRDFINAEEIQFDAAVSEPAWFALRAELTRLGLVEGFDELLCLNTLSDVTMHRYQVETVRKVLRQYRGRVVLADEVGLGKTIEAGMVLKEYALRGMAERMLILTPPSLVGQWRDEMAEKFSLSFVTTHEATLRADPAAFWDAPRIIASLAAARRREHAELLAARPWDIVVIDEAHHLKDQASASYRLVASLQKRFLLLLSATPVQNSLIELYHLLTLLKPGIFKTAREFRAAYMLPGKPREPINRDRLRDLMRGVMVRNTRALAALGLPRRHAATERAVPGPEEAQCYDDLAGFLRIRAAGGAERLSLGHLLAAAGSSPVAAAAALRNASARHPEEPRFATLGERYGGIPEGAKDRALLRLLERNPTEKKIVFVHHRESMAHLATLLTARGIPAAMFRGSLSGAEKDAAIDAFRERVPVLLTSGSGGEGRNLQFCNTLINFDIPWNPMAIEQRIGRIDRIGQSREVFVFNLVAAGTVEEEMLRILDEKINMFELVVGEVGAILGELDEGAEFSSLVLEAWLAETDAARTTALTDLGEQLSAARRTYQGAQQLDAALFGADLDAG